MIKIGVHANHFPTSPVKESKIIILIILLSKEDVSGFYIQNV